VTAGIDRKEAENWLEDGGVVKKLMIRWPRQWQEE
jgi:hypothetical protein